MASGLKDTPGGRGHRGRGRRGGGQGVAVLLARVIGTVVATRKDAGLARHQAARDPAPATPTARAAGKPLVAVDSVGAGAGEDVFYVRGREAAFPFLPARGADRRRHRRASSTTGTWAEAVLVGTGRRQRGGHPEEREARRRQAAAGAAARPRRPAARDRRAGHRRRGRRRGRPRAAGAGRQGRRSRCWAGASRPWTPPWWAWSTRWS